MDESLDEIYLKSKYCVQTEEGLFTLSPGKIDKTFNRFLQKYKITTWAIITSYNPKSIKINNDINEKSFVRLRKELTTYTLREGFNPATPEWPKEITFFIENISSEEATCIGKKYNQNAILFGKQSESPQVIWCF